MHKLWCLFSKPYHNWLNKNGYLINLERNSDLLAVQGNKTFSRPVHGVFSFWNLYWECSGVFWNSCKFCFKNYWSHFLYFQAVLEHYSFISHTISTISCKFVLTRPYAFFYITCKTHFGFKPTCDSFHVIRSQNWNYVIRLVVHRGNFTWTKTTKICSL